MTWLLIYGAVAALIFVGTALLARIGLEDVDDMFPIGMLGGFFWPVLLPPLLIFGLWFAIASWRPLKSTKESEK